MLKDLLKGRATLIELLIGALLLALGVDLLASALVSALRVQDWTLLLMSYSIILLAILLFARKILSSRHVDRAIEGSVVYDVKRSVLVPIPRYHFSEELSDCLGSLFGENEAAKKLWEKDPLTNQLKIDRESKQATQRDTKAGRLIREAVEYVVLNRLSTHLIDYFDRPMYKATQLRTFGREDVPSVLFRNRFLDTFSRPMSDRAAFVDDVVKTKELEKKLPGKVLAVYGLNKRYEDFRLVLPSRARISRLGHGSIQIRTPKFNLRIKSVYDGTDSPLPSVFMERYLGLTGYDEYTSYNLRVGISVTFRTVALLTRTGWHYNMWLDSFLEALEEDVSTDRFLHRIDWEGALTVVDMLKVSAKSDKARGEESQRNDV